jgi:AraC family transcriptional regulator
MSPFLFRITEQNKSSLNRPHESNRVYYSELNKWDCQNAFRSFGIKYVIDGAVQYNIEDEAFEVNTGHFLLANRRDEVAGYVETDELTKSLCIDISTDLLSEAVTVMAARESFDFEAYLAGYFSGNILCARIYSIKDNPLGQKLESLGKIIRSGQPFQLTDEWFLHLMELIVLHEKGNYLALNGIQSVKASTRVETLDRLNKAKAFMNEMFLMNPEMAQVARHCAMSEFHFFRSFKQAFGITPYRYMLNLRLEHSKQLLEKHLSVKEIARHCGFADIFTYSKAFKRAYKLSPTAFLRA